RGHQGLVQQPRDRDLRDRDATGFGNRPHGIDHAESAILVHRRKIERDPARAVRSLAVTRELAAEQAAGKRAPGQDGQLLLPRERHDLPLEVAPGDGVVRLYALESLDSASLADPERLGDLPGGQVAQADVAYLARAHAIVERAEGLLERRQRVESVDLVQVDVFELQTSQALVDAVQDVAAREARLVGARSHATVHFGCQHELITPQAEILQGLARHDLRAARVVDVRGIE